MYDYGKERNQEVYGADTPPVYPLENIRNFPIAILVGKGDMLAAPADCRPLRDLCVAQNSCAFYKEYDFGHMAFLAPHSNHMYFHDMLEMINHLNPHLKMEAKCHHENEEVKSLFRSKSLKA